MMKPRSQSGITVFVIALLTLTLVFPMPATNQSKFEVVEATIAVTSCLTRSPTMTVTRPFRNVAKCSFITTARRFEFPL
jgi:hypothetical protein